MSDEKSAGNEESTAGEDKSAASGEERVSEGPKSSDFLSDQAADDEWKARVEEEKRKLDEKPSQTPPEMPPASFLGLLHELSLRAMIALGQVPSPIDNQINVDLGAARYSIDLLGVLEEKTQGNLSPEESRFLTDLMHNLRLAFVQVSKNPRAPHVPPEGAPGGGESKIII